MDAIGMGIPPILIIDWTNELGAMPYPFMWFLLWVVLMLTGIEQLLASFTNKVAVEQRKNVAIYIVELMVTTALLYLMCRDLSELLSFQNPTDLVTTINTTGTIIVFINGLYLAELLFHSNGMRPSLKIHHLTCILMLQSVTYAYLETKDMSMLRLGVCNVLFAVTEQSVFASMTFYRLFPSWFDKHHQGGEVVQHVWYGSAQFYLSSRVVIAVLNILAYQEFVNEASMMTGFVEGGRTSSSADPQAWLDMIPKMLFPILLLAQLGTQWSCYQGLMSIPSSNKNKATKARFPLQPPEPLLFFSRIVFEAVLRSSTTIRMSVKVPNVRTSRTAIDDIDISHAPKMKRGTARGR